jgi:hypothetical protein
MPGGARVVFSWLTGAAGQPAGRAMTGYFISCFFAPFHVLRGGRVLISSWIRHFPTIAGAAQPPFSSIRRDFRYFQS